MMELRGAPALSPFKQRSLLGQLQLLNPNVRSVYAEFMHFVDLREPLQEQELNMKLRRKKV